ncbi:DNA gyrase inhibitor YacG [Bdellovibrio svalbardensis]|uniref:DNA gyrase inhibitor YacG n=1 Tax=Bdellovibrio svalbardensis TaxID=2972972 RepID=A0ABT6DGJ7_9BACT|nr:DNA gyrase inhibitor YacG [Bdellovibrio svalbardensis]MDG0815375.1 DNA gyrase inhibitor YacG [Bdellovibrio svalbardensis]
MTEPKVLNVKCPQCGRLTLYSPENPFRPFCSERCRLIDLGEWATGGYKIPVKNSSSDSLTSDEDIYDIPDEDADDESKH